jgi:hypothetical protein
MKLEGKAGKVLGRILTAYIRLSNTAIVIRRDDSGLSIESRGLASAQKPIDARIAMIDQARDNLASAIGAIDDLKNAAENNKKEIAEALKTLSSLEQNKSALESRVEAIQDIAQADLETFRMLARVPSDADVRRERLIGFFIGVFASLVAGIFVWILTLLVARLSR